MTYTIELGDKAPKFENLLSTDGSFYSIDEFNNKPLKVIFFTCNHCPYAKAVEDRLIILGNEYENKADLGQLCVLLCQNNETTFTIATKWLVSMMSSISDYILRQNTF